MKKLFLDVKLVDNREIPIDNFAYIGDAVFALKYKIKLLNDGRIKINKVNEKSKKFLSAHAHSKFVPLVEELFSEEEHDIYKRAYNSRGAKKRGNDEEYRKSTALEAVIGFLFLNERFDKIDKIFEVIDKCMFTVEMS